MIALFAAWRKTSVSRQTGSLPESMMSRSTQPVPTEGSWSTSPTRMMEASYGMARTSCHANDDIFVTNNSAFTLTNVVLSANIKGDQDYSRVLKVDSLAPGATKTWENVVSIHGDRVSSKSAALSCDQNK